MTTEKKQSPIDIFRGNVAKMEPQFKAALPPQIQTEKFMRVVVTAVQSDPNLLAADQRSLFQSSMKAAQDGLIPDGREAALVVFNKKNRQTGQYEKHVQYMPMMAGILKKVRNSGELSTISANVVYENDHFDYELGDEERIFHKPHLGLKRGKAIAAYAIARMKDGGIYRAVMSVEEIEEIRKISRSKDDGPWVVHWGEMAKKTVLRRLSKMLPMSTDLETVIERDDEMYEPIKERAAAPAPEVDVTPPAADQPPPAAEGKKRSGRMAAAVDAAKQQQQAPATPPEDERPPIDGHSENVDDGNDLSGGGGDPDGDDDELPI